MSSIFQKIILVSHIGVIFHSHKLIFRIDDSLVYEKNHKDCIYCMISCAFCIASMSKTGSTLTKLPQQATQKSKVLCNYFTTYKLSSDFVPAEKKKKEIMARDGATYYEFIANSVTPAVFFCRSSLLAPTSLSTVFPSFRKKNVGVALIPHVALNSQIQITKKFQSIQLSTALIRQVDPENLSSQLHSLQFEA